MWFIPMIAGLYLCIPFIKPIAVSEGKVKYYLILAFLFAFIIPETVTVVNDFGNRWFIKGINTINSTIGNVEVHMIMGYAAYFVLGYYLNKIDISKKQRMIIYLLGLAGFILTITLSLSITLKTQQPCGQYYGNFTVNVLMESIAVFVWFKYRKYDKARLYPIMAKLLKYSFGAYLVHALIIELLNDLFGLNTFSFNAAVSVIIIGVIVFVISFAISAVLNHIPILKKYVV
ncbi:MAG: acyltransferase [Blautia sp.]|nr:acyltransferase [Lachnoclostridium sp.]MCM1211926.1 acyltransferase [Blautia sp.]